MSDLSWLNPTPHAIAVYASRPLSPVAAQHSLPSGRYSLLGPDFHRLDRTSLRLAHSFDHLVGAGEQRTCKRNSFHARSAIINGLPSRTSNSGDCKWGHFWPAIRWRYAAFQTSKKGAKFQKI